MYKPFQLVYQLIEELSGVCATYGMRGRIKCINVIYMHFRLGRKLHIP